MLTSAYWKPGHATLGQLTLDGPPSVSEMGLSPTSKELRRIAVNDILPLWTALREAVNADCGRGPGLMTRFTNIESTKHIPDWCWRGEKVQSLLLAFVSRGRAWVATVNTFLEKYGESLWDISPEEVLKLGEEFDRISVRLSAVSDFTLEKPFWTFFRTLPQELEDEARRKFGEDGDFWVYLGLGLGAVTGIWLFWVFLR